MKQSVLSLGDRLDFKHFSRRKPLVVVEDG
jgi:hypothetical protein